MSAPATPVPGEVGAEAAAAKLPTPAGPPAAAASLGALKIGFLGAGMMASAMISGFLAKGLATPAQIIASDVSKELLKKQEALGVRVTSSNKEVVEFADVIVLAVKVCVLPPLPPLPHFLYSCVCTPSAAVPLPRVWVYVLGGIGCG